MAKHEQDQQHADSQLSPELLILLNAFRSEIDAKVGNLKLWGTLGLLGGSTVSGLIARFTMPGATHTAVHAVVGLLT